MDEQRKRILARAERLQRQGRVGDSIKLRLLAAELKTMRFGEEIVHTCR